MADPYKTLGVARDATPDEIRKAYRRLAKQHHPDLHPGDEESERRFKEISAANSIIGDEEKRARFDRGEIDESGAERPEQQYYRRYAESDPGMRYRAGSGPGGFEDLGGIFGEFFHGRTGPGGPGGSFKARGGDLRYTMSIDFLESMNGGKKRVDMPDGKTLDINIPAGIRDGQTLRLAGEGMAGIGGGPKGDALVEILVRPHPVFKRDGDDIRSVVPITLSEALNSGKVRVETVTGAVDVNVPRGSGSGDMLRLRGKGAPKGSGAARGDHLVELKLVLPDKPDEELARLVADWEARHPYDPRRKTRATA